MDQKVSQLNSTQEISTARQAALYRSANQSYSIALSSATDTWSFGAACAVTLDTAGLAFAATDSNGLVHGYFTVIESASLSSVLEASWNQQDTVMTMCGGSPVCFSGYDFYDPGVANGYNSGSWQLPIANPSYACGNGCTEKLALWAGETTILGGNTGIAQTGTLSTVAVTCGFRGCNTGHTYSIWYEFYPGPLNICNTGLSFPGPGDKIQAQVSNTYSTGIYYTYVVDNSIGKACSSSSKMSMGVPPKWYEFLAENPLDTLTGTPWQNPNSGTFTFANMLLGGQGAYGSPACTNYQNWPCYYEWTMIPNDQVGPLSISSSLNSYYSQTDNGCAC